MPLQKPFRAVPIQLGRRYRAKARREKIKRIIVSVAVLAGAAVLGATVGILPAINLPFEPSGYGDMVGGCTVIDGDTLRCDGERIRLLGIDAPELPGHCREGRSCVRGDPYPAKGSLAEALIGTIRITRFGIDRYGRTLAMVSSDNGDLSCWQLRQGEAVYKPQWDDEKQVMRTCPKSVLL